jgi:hypothetical protein
LKKYYQKLYKQDENKISEEVLAKQQNILYVSQTSDKENLK